MFKLFKRSKAKKVIFKWKIIYSEQNACWELYIKFPWNRWKSIKEASSPYLTAVHGKYNSIQSNGSRFREKDDTTWIYGLARDGFGSKESADCTIEAFKKLYIEYTKLIENSKGISGKVTTGDLFIESL